MQGTHSPSAGGNGADGRTRTRSYNSYKHLHHHSPRSNSLTGYEDRGSISAGGGIRWAEQDEDEVAIEEDEDEVGARFGEDVTSSTTSSTSDEE